MQPNGKAGEAVSNGLPQHRQGRGAGRAQAMVEFALALPVFLLMVYGLLEVGRLIFMEAAVTTASREAVRYASAYGRIGNAGNQQYQDCTGIRNEAKRVGILLGLTDADVDIGWDDGPSTGSHPYCLAGYTSPDTSVALVSGQRVVVTVRAVYNPILPLFLPLTQVPMASTTARTILGIIDLPTPAP
jgi:Flp pilus assembly protein TadG